ncbi:hypothetical protein D3C78_1167770 [compost metagenome]
MEQAEGNLRVRQRNPLHGIHAMAELGGLGPQELAPRGHGVEQLAHVHGGAGRAGSGADLHATGVDLPGVLAVAGARNDGDLGHGGNRGQRFATKPHRRHGFQFVQRPDLAGGVAGQRQRQFVGWNAAAVVRHGDTADAAALQAHFDGAAARVDRVLKDFLEHGGRPLDHLASGNLADEQVGKRKNGTAFCH